MYSQNHLSLLLLHSGAGAQAATGGGVGTTDILLYAGTAVALVVMAGFAYALWKQRQDKTYTPAAQRADSQVSVYEDSAQSRYSQSGLSTYDDSQMSTYGGSQYSEYSQYSQYGETQL